MDPRPTVYPAPRTTAQRQQDLRDSRRSKGLKEVRNLWCAPDDELALRKFAAKLGRGRQRGQKTVPALAKAATPAG